MFMAVAVTNSVPTIVRYQDVTFLMEPVTVVHLDGLEFFVKKSVHLAITDWIVLTNVLDFVKTISLVIISTGRVTTDV